MNSFPLVFRFQDAVIGNGFVAGVIAQGRVLLSQEDEGFWMYGVTPGGLAGGGSDRASAFREFKMSYLSVLFDIASEADSYDEFQTEVRRFFDEVNKPTEALWCEALAGVRSGSVTAPDLETVSADERLPSVAVELLERAHATPAFNRFDQVLEAA